MRSGMSRTQVPILMWDVVFRRQCHGHDRVHEAGDLAAGEDRRVAGALDGRDGVVGDPVRLEAGVLDVLGHDGGIDVHGGRIGWVG